MKRISASCSVISVSSHRCRWLGSPRIAERAGHEVIIIDARTLQLTPDQVLRRLKEWKPDVLGFMMTTYMFRETLDWIRYLRGGLPGVKVMVGGYNLRVYPKESVMPPEIDFGCFNSAYHTVPRLLEELEGGAAV